MEIQKIIEILATAGFHKNEALVYLELIKKGKSTANEISKKTKIHRTNVYDTLNEMVKKGLATQGIEENKKIFYPIEPKNLIDYLKQKEYNLRKIIPEIQKIHNMPPAEERRVRMAEGIQAIREVINNFLELNKPIYIYGIPKDITKELGGFIQDFHKRRIKKKIPMMHIYNRNAEKRIKELNSMEYTQARFLPSLYDTTISTNICGNKVVLIFWEKPFSAIIIENQAIADTYKKYFDILWEEAKITL